jgi:hypothetical protein
LCIFLKTFDCVPPHAQKDIFAGAPNNFPKYRDWRYSLLQPIGHDLKRGFIFVDKNVMQQIELIQKERIGIKVAKAKNS